MYPYVDEHHQLFPHVTFLPNVRFEYHDLAIVIFRRSFSQAKGQSMLLFKPFIVAFWTGYT
jgi:hypothetical protein